MKKIAFIVIRYGQEINGGAELHCKMLAERLVDKYQVEVLTTNLKGYSNQENIFKEGEEVINGVLVRRFKTDPYKRKGHRPNVWATRYIRSIRFFLYKMHLLQYIANCIPIWKCGKKGVFISIGKIVFTLPNYSLLYENIKKIMMSLYL